MALKMSAKEMPVIRKWMTHSSRLSDQQSLSVGGSLKIVSATTNTSNTLRVDSGLTRTGQVRSECLTSTFRTSCYSKHRVVRKKVFSCLTPIHRAFKIPVPTSPLADDLATAPSGPVDFLFSLFYCI